MPEIFHVNWFRQNEDGKFLWPGFGENLRVLRWIIDRCEGRVGAVETPIGHLPQVSDIDVQGLDISDADLETLTSIDPEQWKQEIASIGEYLESYGERLPAALREQVARVAGELQSDTLEKAS